MCYEHSRRPQRTFVAAAVNVLALERWYDVADKATWKNLADIGNQARKKGIREVPFSLKSGE